MSVVARTEPVAPHCCTASILALHVFVNCSGALALRAAMLPAAAASLAICVTELLKLLLCVVLLWREAGSRLPEVLRAAVISNPGSLKFAFPAIAYTLQQNLIYFALTRVDVPTVQVLSESKTLLTATLSWLLLDRRLMTSQWLALCMLSVGGCLTVGVANVNMAAVMGVGAVLTAATLSSACGVYIEKLLKAPDMTRGGRQSLDALWLRNCQLSLFFVPASVAVCAYLTLGASSGIPSALSSLAHAGPLAAFAIVIHAIGGIVVGAALRYTSAVAKTVATAVAVVVSTTCSVPLFGFEPSTTFGVGAACTILASILFVLAPRIDGWLHALRCIALATAATAAIFIAKPSLLPCTTLQQLAIRRVAITLGVDGLCKNTNAPVWKSELLDFNCTHAQSACANVQRPVLCIDHKKSQWCRWASTRQDRAFAEADNRCWCIQKLPQMAEARNMTATSCPRQSQGVRSGSLASCVRAPRRNRIKKYNSHSATQPRHTSRSYRPKP
mmetsp:Transcript_46182/g.76360  ORF Transcript_46182/g.76360 Transcript_46182/m.76360 type:complete len:501 (+) Transcript_46182:177-1679(+)